jgi:hypothetical protein
MCSLLLLPFKLVFFALKVVLGLVFFVLGLLLVPLLVLAAIGFAIRSLVC